MRKQRAFASLSEPEINQVAEWVRAQKYDDVIARVAQPRPEGFGLKVSRKPLQLLFAKVSRLEKINAHLTTGTKLTLTALDQIEAGEKPDLCEETHDAILIATHDIATNDECNPTQLLALQRLADFPERAALRAQSAEDLSRLREQSAAIRAERLEITRAREARAQAKAQRETEMHTHKIQMDHIRVFLKSNNRGGTSFSGGTSSSGPSSRDAIDYNAAQVGSVCLSGQSSKSEIKNQTSEIRSPLSTLNSQRSTFLSPEVIANTNLYDQKIDAGEIRVIYAPGKHYEIEYCNPADKPALERMHKSAPVRFFEDPTRTHYLPGLRTFGKNPYIPPTNTQDSEFPAQKTSPARNAEPDADSSCVSADPNSSSCPGPFAPQRTHARH